MVDVLQKKSRFVIKDREIDFVLEKLETGPYWGRLIKDETKTHWIKVDYEKWLDEEELKEKENDTGLPNFDEMGWNTFMEVMKRNMPLGDNENPIEALAKTNNSMKHMFSNYQQKQQENE